MPPPRWLLAVPTSRVLVAPVAPVAAATTVTVFYQPPASWPTVDTHYSPDGGAWTAVPGVSMDAACTGWREKDLDLGFATGLQITFAYVLGSSAPGKVGSDGPYLK